MTGVNTLFELFSCAIPTSVYSAAVPDSYVYNTADSDDTHNLKLAVLLICFERLEYLKNYHRIANTLHRLTKRGEIIRVGRGLYRARTPDDPSC